MRNGVVYLLPPLVPPHIRDRIFIVAYPAGTVTGQIFHREIAMADTDILGSQGVREERACEGWEDSDGYFGSGCLVTRRFLEGWATEPAIRRMGYGFRNRVQRITGLGNAIVPQVAQFIARRISERFKQ